MSNHRARTNTAATVVAVVADITAAILGLWIVMFLLHANRSNDLVSFVEDAARWLAGWPHDLFTMDTEWLRVVLNYGLPVLVYLAVGHAVANRLRRAHY
ncbi:hypothetical protein ABZ484_16965 [Streptomyces sp. NPDC006393]|uniref:hypothetical protein n=1 Tax=Streptomyces sp. NPDC006393 TaxID=3156763 RepID=UPI0034014388